MTNIFELVSIAAKLTSSQVDGSMTGRVANRYFSRAFRWQRRFLFIAIPLIVGLVFRMFDSPITTSSMIAYGLLLLAVCAVVAMLAVCYYVYKGSISSRGRLYSALHVALIILLTPAFCVGVFVIPSLTNGDVLRLRDWDRQHPNGT